MLYERYSKQSFFKNSQTPETKLEISANFPSLDKKSSSIQPESSSIFSCLSQSFFISLNYTEFFILIQFRTQNNSQTLQKENEASQKVSQQKLTQSQQIQKITANNLEAYNHSEENEQNQNFNNQINSIPLHKYSRSFDKISQKVIVQRKVTKESEERINHKTSIHEELFENRFYKVFKHHKFLARGAVGEVYKVIHKIDNENYAIKRINLMIKQNEELQQHSLFREVNAMTKLHHKSIIRYNTTWIEKSQIPVSSKQIPITFSEKSSVEEFSENEDESNNNFEYDDQDEIQSCDLGLQWSRNEITQENIESPLIATKPKENKSANYDLKVVLHIQMEYCKGQTLEQYFTNPNRKINSFDNYLIIQQLLEGLQYMHSYGIMHRDLKPSNIFLEDKHSLNIKIGDFGLSKLHKKQLMRHTSASQAQFKSAQERLKKKRNLSSMKLNQLCDSNDDKLTQRIGTPLYIAPEIYEEESYTSTVDIYSLGIILLEMILKPDTTFAEKLFTIKSIRNNGQFEDSLKNQFPYEIHLIQFMLSPKQIRPTATQLLQSQEYLNWKSHVLSSKFQESV